MAGIPLGSAAEAELRQRISITTEAPGLDNRLTVAENLEFFARLYGLTGRGDRIYEALSAVGLTARADDLCGSLSKGLKQRASLARSLLNDPAVMFLDEPTSGLDPAAAHEVLGLVSGLRQRGVTVFLTTHRLDEAERLCDRVAIMNTSLRTIGTPDELRRTLFSRSLAVSTVIPLEQPDKEFHGLPAVQGSQPESSDGTAGYLLTVTDPAAAAPADTRALVAAGADVLSISETRHSLEDVYLELIDQQESPSSSTRTAGRWSARNWRTSGATGSSSSPRRFCRSSSSSARPPASSRFTRRPRARCCPGASAIRCSCR